MNGSATSPARKGRAAAPRASARLSASARVAVRRLHHFTQLELADLAAVLSSTGVDVSAANLERDLADAGRPLGAALDVDRASWYVAAASALWDGADDAPIARVLRSALQARDAAFPLECEFERLRQRLKRTIECFDKRNPFSEWLRDEPFTSQFHASDWPQYFVAGETIISRDSKKMRYRRERVDGSEPVSFQLTVEDFRSRGRSRAAAREAFEGCQTAWPQWTVGDSLPIYERDLFAIFMPSLQRRLLRDFIVALRLEAKNSLPIALRERGAAIRWHAAALRSSSDTECPEPLPDAIAALPACRKVRMSTAALLRTVESPKAREQPLSQGERLLLSELVWKVEHLGTVYGGFETVKRDLRARRMLEVCFSA